MVQCVLQCEH